MIGRTSILGLATAVLMAGLSGSGTALPIAPNTAQVGQVSNVIEVAQKKGGGKSAAKAKPRASSKAKASAKAKPRAKASAAKHSVAKKTVVKKTVVRRTVVVRPYRAWVHRPYYGTIIAGVALGTVILVSAPRIVPVAPAPNLCWFWSDQDQVHGYWDYCTPPL